MILSIARYNSAICYALKEATDGELFWWMACLHIWILYNGHTILIDKHPNQLLCFLCLGTNQVYPSHGQQSSPVGYIWANRSHQFTMGSWYNNNRTQQKPYTCILDNTLASYGVTGNDRAKNMIERRFKRCCYTKLSVEIVHMIQDSRFNSLLA